MKKLAIILAIVMMLSSFNFAYADATEISYTTWALSEETLIPVYGGSVDVFMEENPDIVVDYSQTNPYADYLTQLKIAASAGTAPYVAHIKAEWLPELLEMGVVKDIRPYISDEVIADYNEATIAAVSDGEAMNAIPWFGNAYALWCNKDLMAQAGITELPSTWEELLEDAKLISALGDDIYGLPLANSNGIEAGEGYNMLPFLWAYGAEWGDFTSENAIKAFTCMKELIDTGVSSSVGNSLKDIRRMFGEGKVGFYWDIESGILASASAAADEEAFYKNFDVIEIPGSKGYAINHFLVVLDSCPDEKMEAVGKFLEYMTGSTCIKIFYEGKQGKVSGRSSVNDAVFEGVSGVSANYVQAMTNANPLPIDIHFMESETYVVDLLTAIAQGTSVEDAAADLQEAYNELYED